MRILTLLVLLIPGFAQAIPSNIALDTGGSFSWGSYSSTGVPDDTHAGMAIPLYGGYRFDSGAEAGLTGTVAFPEVSTQGAVANNDFTYTSFGLQAGYLFRQKLEPFVVYYPYANLSETTKTPMPSGLLTTDLEYHGQAFGAGAKLYLTDRDSRAVQVGLRFAYTYEDYSRATTETSFDGANPGAAFGPTTTPAPQDQRVTGNTYQLGLFIGI